MHKILEAYKANEIDAIDALSQVGEALKTANKVETKLLLRVSDAILDMEVPLEERNMDAEETYLAKLGKDEE